MSLKEIAQKPGQKEVTKENKNALKDALLKVLQQNGASTQNTHVEVIQQDSKEIHSEKVTVDIKPEEVHEDLPKQSGDVVKPGEIPEDQLKKILEVE
jgi:hypothetical protein